jgi:hypothetical protein
VHSLAGRDILAKHRTAFWLRLVFGEVGEPGRTVLAEVPEISGHESVEHRNVVGADGFVPLCFQLGEFRFRLPRTDVGGFVAPSPTSVAAPVV